MVHHDMGLAGQHQLASAGAQVLAHGYLANGQGHAVPGGPMRGRVAAGVVAHARWPRSEEHTSELQSLMRISYAVFCLKKKKNQNKYIKNDQKLQIRTKTRY